MEYFTSRKLSILIVVFAVIVAGFFVYHKRHRVNAIMDYVAKCAVIAQTEGTGEGPVPRKLCQSYLGNAEKIFYKHLGPDDVTVERFENGNTFVIISFSQKDEITALLAEITEQPNNPIFVFYVGRNYGWTSGTSEQEALQNIPK